MYSGSKGANSGGSALHPFLTTSCEDVNSHGFFVVKLLNYFPAKGGVLAHYSPKTIMLGQTLNYKQCSYLFGTYCQVHEEDGQRNSLIARTSGAISVGVLRLIGREDTFFSLSTLVVS